MADEFVRLRSMRLLEAAAAAAAVTVALLTSCASIPTGPRGSAVPPTPSGSGSATTSASEGPAPGGVTVIASGLQAPWSIAFDGESALISERDSGRILELTRGGAIREVGVVSGVAPGGEGGMLGIAVRDGSLYAYLTTASDNRIVRFALTGAAGARGIGPPETILQGLPHAANHNGGRIAFGPDGMLYATVGDADDASSAQDFGSRGGKILRVTADGGIPPDNPFAGSPVYSFGHRNPQGLAWDAGGTLYASEFGQNTWDELNVIEAGGNYGWPTVEGIAEREGFIDPVQQWAPVDASPSGIAITSGAIWIANLRGARLRQVPLKELAASTEYLVREFGRLRDVVVAPDGALWVLTNNTDGRGQPTSDDDRILRVTP